MSKNTRDQDIINMVKIFKGAETPREAHGAIGGAALATLRVAQIPESVKENRFDYIKIILIFMSRNV